MRPTSDHLLVDAALLGSRAAFEELYGRHGDSVYAFAIEATGSEDEALSITQDVFIAAWTNLEKISLGTGSVLPWLLTAAQFRCNHAARRAGRRPKTVDIADYVLTQVDTDSLESTVDAGQLLDRIEKEVSTMTPLDARVFRALIHDGLSYGEAASQIGISVDSVTKRMKRVRSRLRDSFKGERL
jgi:RNA polymerase sigma factor (sigma-70 family)